VRITLQSAIFWDTQLCNSTGHLDGHGFTLTGRTIVSNQFYSPLPPHFTIITWNILISLTQFSHNREKFCLKEYNWSQNKYFLYHPRETQFPFTKKDMSGHLISVKIVTLCSKFLILETTKINACFYILKIFTNAHQVKELNPT
jgi:hypothetical protein